MTTFFYGTDTYRLRDAVREAVRALRKRGPILVQTIDGTDADASERLRDALASQGLFGEARLIVLNNALLMPDTELWNAHTIDDVTVIATQDTQGIDAKGKRQLAALLKHRTEATCFDVLEGKERLAWISGFCRERARTITPTAAGELVRRTGTDTWALANELEKLCAYAETAIDDAAVHALVAPPAVFDEWELSNAFAARDKRAALAALWRRLRSGAPEQLVIGLLASATRTLVLVKAGIDRKMSAASISKATGLHPFVVSKNLKSVASADATAIRATHLRIATLDRDGKRGRADILDGLFSIIVGMA